jgi:hypothetical protein
VQRGIHQQTGSHADPVRRVALDKSEALSRTNYSVRCRGVVMFAREAEDKDSGKHLSLNHRIRFESLVGFCYFRGR